jgi:hypothetical protein
MPQAEILSNMSLGPTLGIGMYSIFKTSGPPNELI